MEAIRKRAQPCRDYLISKRIDAQRNARDERVIGITVTVGLAAGDSKILQV